MKTQIITLESHDDLISVRDRMSWAKTPRILLVWPKYADVALRFVDLKVLQRHANSLGAQLGLVTRRASVRRDAEALHIPVFESTSAAQRDPWPARRFTGRHTPRPPRRDLRALRESVYEPEAKWRSNPALRAALFSLAVLAVLTVASLFVPRAALTLYPEAQTQSITIPVTASAAIKSASLTGSVPLQTLTLSAGGAQTMTVTGQIKIPQAKAQGLARFTNLGESEILIPKGTIIYAAAESNGRINFMTLHETRLPAGVNQFVEAPIEAMNGGAEANLPAGAIRFMDGALALSISVTNPEATEGGTERSARGASEEDRRRLRDGLLRALEKQALDELESGRFADEFVLQDTLSLSKIVDEIYDPPAGQPGNSLRLTMEVEYTVQAVAERDLRQIASTSLAASIPADFAPAPDSLVLSIQSAPVMGDDQSVSFQLKAEQTLLRRMDQAQIMEYIGGHSKEMALSNLQAGLLLRRPPELALTPSWWPWLPSLPFRVSVETK